MKSPIELLVAIADDKQQAKIKRVLNSFDLNYRVIMSGKGTADSAIEDIFSFGIIEKVVIATIVETQNCQAVCDKLMHAINAKQPKGIIFSMPISAVSSDLFNIVKEETNA